MAVIRDVMPAFQLFQPSSVAGAQKLLEQHGREAWVMAGGLDSFDWLKDRIKKPKALVDLSGIEELRGVRTNSDGIEIGAMTTLTEVVNHPVVKEKYGLLAQAAGLVASPQIRNQGTLGGNVSTHVKVGLSTIFVGIPLRFRRWASSVSDASAWGDAGAWTTFWRLFG